MRRLPGLNVLIALMFLIGLSLMTNATPVPTDAQSAVQPANPNASPRARRLLAYLHSLNGRTEKRLIAGQFGAFGTDETVLHAELYQRTIFNKSGKYAAMTGVDYDAHCLHTGSCTLEALNTFLIERWNEQRALIVVSWHAPNPWRDVSAVQWYERWNPPAGDVADLLPGGRLRGAWTAALDRIAAALDALQQARVVVIWRPFHEMNGEWFWWGKLGDPISAAEHGTQFVRLWRDMFDYFTREKRLNHLLWGYSPNTSYASLGGYVRKIASFYPGGDYVDVVGLDHYLLCGSGLHGCDEDPIDLERQAENGVGAYTKLAEVAPDKPMGLFEFGSCPARWEDPCPKYDYAKLPRDVRALYPRLVFFQAWESRWSIAQNENISGLMADPLIISADDLPDFRVD